MLSAVAARKNRLQQQGTPGSSSPSSRATTPPPDTPQRGAEEAAQKQRSKRKSSDSQAASTSRKRKNTKQSAAESAPATNKDSRYFQSLSKDAATPDLMVVEDDHTNDEDSGSDSSGDNSSVVAVEPPARPWSPSAPARDQDLTMDDYFFTGRTKKLQPPHFAGQASLSSYEPILDQNFFPLSMLDMQSLKLDTGSHEHNACIVLLSPSQTLALLGSYRLQLLGGRLTLAGVTLTPSSMSHLVFAPRCAAISVIEGATDMYRDDPLVALLPERISKSMHDLSSVVLLEEMQSGVEGLGKVMKTFEDVFSIPRPRQAESDPQLGLRGVRLITHSTMGLYPYHLPDSWDAALSSAVPSRDSSEEVDYSRKVFFVKGAKKSGKSTFARTLLNRLTTKYRYVAFLECDLGQSEFTPGGMVALNIVSQPLFGPPFTHPSAPYQAHFIGSTTPSSSPSHYLSAIEALVHTYNTGIQHALYTAPAEASDSRIDDIIPLVVNMMGWTKGLGANLSDRVEDILQPSMVFEFDAPVYEDGYGWTPAPYRDRGDATPFYDPSPSAPKPYPVHRLSPAGPPPGASNKYTPADMRQLSILSYLHAVFPSQEQTDSPASVLAHSWDTSLPLCAQPPYELSCLSALDLVVLAGPGSEDVVSSEVHRVLNGALVGLVSYEPDTLEVDLEEAKASHIPYVQGTSSPAPTSSSCLGLALIRSLSSSSSPSATLQIITPVPASTLSRTPPRILVKGDMELPVWGMLDFRSETHIVGVSRSEVPYLRWGSSEAVGANRRRTRRNLMRKGQM